MGALSKVAGWLESFPIGRGQAPAVPQAPASHGRRAFEAGQANRLAKDWSRTENLLNQDLRVYLPALRARSRDLIKNSGFAARFIHMTQTNVVGSEGVQLQMRVTEPDNKGGLKADDEANKMIEAAWDEWCRPENCTVHGRYSCIDVQTMAVGAEEGDGEFFLRHIFNAKNRFGYSVQIIDAALLDEQKQQERGPGINRITMGIEQDDYDKPLAYWFKKRGLYNDTFERVRVPAEEIIHFFVPRSVDQARGYPAMTPVMGNLRQLKAYYEAEIVAARMGAAKAGFFTSKTGEEYTGKTNEEAGGRSMEVEPGVFEELPEGMDFKPFDPTHPTTAFSDFVKAMKRDFASGVNRGYNAMANDYESVNFSSLRASVLEDRESYKVLQRLLIQQVLGPVFKEWLGMALLKRAIPLPLAKFDKYNQAIWHGRRWGWVDPLKDIQATQAALESGLTTHSRVLAEAGEDLDETWDELSKEKKEAAALGLELKAFLPPVPPQAATKGDVDAAAESK